MNPRLLAIQTIHQRPRSAASVEQKPPSEIFGENIFSPDVMRQHLSPEVFAQLQAYSLNRKTLDRGISDAVAIGIKTWAIQKGATHFTHWFQPLNGRTAEKHQSFLNLEQGTPLDHFSGNELVQQEPDASSFPSGGLRSTFEARGYTAWDCSSPIFIFETRHGKTLCIPTIFVSFTGEALDYKIPLLRSIAMLDEAATEVAQIFDPKIERVNVHMGAEQEFFLVDKAFFDLRPDLLITGRTIIGSPPPRSQHLGGHYFGAIPPRAFAFMSELETACHKLGIPLTTRHNEAAPSQYECAPDHEPLNVAIDHQLLLMDLIDRLADRHHFAALLHEKPFSGVNGSGKHNNWSLQTGKGRNLLSPGPTPEANLMFLAFFVCVIRAVAEHADLLLASIASPGNDLRLDGPEAPPSIISVFVGTMLNKVLDDIENPPRRKRNEQVSDLMHLGISEIPELLVHNTDRNRTSPFAFTGNKFEFRAVGASANSSGTMAILNAMVTQKLKRFKKRVESKINRGRNKESAVLDMLREYISESKHVRFEGDSSSLEWQAEAKKRKLSQISHAPQAYEAFLDPKAYAVLVESGLYSEAELKARHEVLLQSYLGQLQSEVDVLEELLNSYVFPALLEQQRSLLELWQLTQSGKGKTPNSLARISEGIHVLESLQVDLSEVREQGKAIQDSRKLAFYYAEEVVPRIQAIQTQVNQLEALVPDANWPLPKIREMLFIG